MTIGICFCVSHPPFHEPKKPGFCEPCSCTAADPDSDLLTYSVNYQYTQQQPNCTSVTRCWSSDLSKRGPGKFYETLPHYLITWCRDRWFTAMAGDD